MKIWAVALNTFREAVRNKILYSVIFFAICLVATAAVFGSVTMGEQSRVIIDFGLFSLSFFGAIITIIVGVNLLSKELKQKTVYNILSKPVSRWQFIVGKYLGITGTVAVLVLLMGLGLMVFVSMYTGELDRLILVGTMFAIMEVAIVAAIAMFFSTVVVTITLSGLFTLAAYLAGRSIGYLTYFLKEGEADYDPAIASVVEVLYWILPDLSLFNFADKIVYGEAVPLNSVALALGYCVCYSTVLLVLATLVFRKRELT